MNDAVLNDLAAHVVLATGSIPASAARRRQIHEELLAHLLDLYDQELERLQDERAAADRAKQRFGRVDDLRSDLATAVPWLERLIFLMCGKESIMWRWLGMYLVGVMTVFVGMGFVLPAVAQLRSPTPIMPNDRFGIAVLFPFGVVVTLLGVVLMGYNLFKGFRARRC